MVQQPGGQPEAQKHDYRDANGKWREMPDAHATQPATPAISSVGIPTLQEPAWVKQQLQPMVAEQNEAAARGDISAQDTQRIPVTDTPVTLSPQDLAGRLGINVAAARQADTPTQTSIPAMPKGSDAPTLPPSKPIPGGGAPMLGLPSKQ